MKTITNVEVKLIRLESNDILTTSTSAEINGYSLQALTGARDYYEDEE